MTRIGFPLLCLAALCGTVGSAVCGVEDLCAQEAEANPSDVGRKSSSSGQKRRWGEIDSDTRWAFRALTHVTVSSPIVRLGDVVQPLDPNMVGWQRLRRSPIGLLPLGSQPMTIQRNRLERAILDAEATPLSIDWIGPSEIHVRYEEAKVQTALVVDAGGNDAPAIAQASQTLISPDAAVQAVGAAVPVSGADRPVSELDVSRISHWVMLGMERAHPEVLKEFRIEMPVDQPKLSSLAALVGVTDLSPIQRIAEGDCRFQLTGRTGEGTIESEICLTLTPHPKVAVPRKVLTKGHRLSIQDLEMQPIAEDQIESDYVLDPSEVVGMEVRGFPRPGRPLSRSDVGAPTLIRRGDLIEVRVMGGSVTVTTNAKAHGDGAESELIEVETLEPRKRLLARVVQPGLVEIVTRAPRVQP